MISRATRLHSKLSAFRNFAHTQLVSSVQEEVCLLLEFEFEGTVYHCLCELESCNYLSVNMANAFKLTAKLANWIVGT